MADDKEFGHRVEISIPAQPMKAAKRRDRPRPRIGLALGSGIARGWAHIGVLRALDKAGIEVDIVAGTSAGALVGAAYVTGKLDMFEDWARSFTKAKMVSYLDFSGAGGGVIRGQRLVALISKYFKGLDMKDTDRPFVTVATDLVTGHEAWLRHGKLTDNVRASFSVPGIFPPVWLDRWLVDGALVNPVPVSVCQALGARMTIAVNLNADLIGKVRDAGERVPRVAGFDLLSMIEGDQETLPEDMRAPRRWFSLTPFVRNIFKRDPGSPSLFGVMVSTLGIVQDRITRSRLAGEPPDIHITPKVGHIGLMEFHRAEELIKAGEDAVNGALDEIKAAIEVFNLSHAQPDSGPEEHE
jgi:NTE family protein